MDSTYTVNNVNFGSDHEAADSYAQAMSRKHPVATIRVYSSEAGLIAAYIGGEDRSSPRRGCHVLPPIPQPTPWHGITRPVGLSHEWPEFQVVKGKR